MSGPSQLQLKLAASLNLLQVCVQKAFSDLTQSVSVWTNADSPNNITLDSNSVQASLAHPASLSWIGLAGSAGNPPWQWCSFQPL